MSIFQQIKRGIQARPQRVIVYGPEGVGKSTLAAGFPNPLFVDTEEGTSHLDVARVQVKSLAEIEELIDQLMSEKHDFKTFVLDTIDWAEQLMINAIIREKNDQKIKNIEDFGYGKGYVIAANRMGEFLKKLNALMEIGMNVVLLGHSRRVKFELPESVGSYDKYELKLTKHCSPLVKEWSDAILFMNFITSTQDGKGIGGEARMVYTSPQAPWEAKNRYNLPSTLPAEPAEISRLIFSSASAPVQSEKHESLADVLEREFGDLPTLEFLIARNEIPGNGTWRDISKGYAQRMLARKDIFRKTVNEWKGEPVHAN